MDAEEKKVPERPKRTGKAILVGCLTGMCQISLLYPVKFVKVQLQLEEKFGKERMYTGMFDCAYKTVKAHGILGLYRGLNVFLYAGRSAVTFGTYEALKWRFIDDNGVLSPTNIFLCGLFAGGFEAALINTPLEAVECKLIHDRRLGISRLKGFFHGAVVTVREEGIKGLYAGFTPSIIKQAGNQGIRFFTVEGLKNLYQGGDPKESVPKVFVALFGLAGGFFSVLLTNPVDVVKTRLQGLDYSKYKNMFHCFYSIWKGEGFYAFYRGLSPRLSRVCAEVSITFFLYDVFMDFVKEK